jgi:hypothetical protein
MMMMMIWFISEVKSKVVPVLNSAAHYEDVWQSGGTVPYILDFSTKLR